jgi:hypothetical protein
MAVATGAHGGGVEAWRGAARGARFFSPPRTPNVEDSQNY